MDEFSRLIFWKIYIDIIFFREYQYEYVFFTLQSNASPLALYS